MEQKKKSDDNLISFGALDEFDPVAHQFEGPGKEGAASGADEAENFDPNSGAQARSGDGDLLGLGGVASSSVEEPDKKMIYVYHKGEKNCVGWYSDMVAEDIKEAILCACDAIMDGGFVLREVQLADEEEKTEPKEDGRVFEFEQFDQLQNGQTYIIEAAGERDDLKKITGDRFRRLKVQIDPKLHVEAVKAIDRMRRGANLLKHTHYGFPHLRQFQLSDDCKRLIWYSGAKRKEDSMVVEIKLGQQTPVFLHYRLPMLEHLSFSIIHGPKGSKTLDLTCKDEFEFDHWVTGLKAIFYSSKNKQISKEALLAHSKRFQKAMEKNNVGIKLTKLPEVKEKGHVGLDDCIEIVTHTPQQLDTKMERLRERLKTMSQQVSRLDHHSAAEMEVQMLPTNCFAQDPFPYLSLISSYSLHDELRSSSVLLRAEEQTCSDSAPAPGAALLQAGANRTGKDAPKTVDLEKPEDAENEDESEELSDHEESLLKRADVRHAAELELESAIAGKNRRRRSRRRRRTTTTTTTTVDCGSDIESYSIGWDVTGSIDYCAEGLNTGAAAESINSDKCSESTRDKWLFVDQGTSVTCGTSSMSVAYCKVNGNQGYTKLKLEDMGNNKFKMWWYDSSGTARYASRTSGYGGGGIKIADYSNGDSSNFRVYKNAVYSNTCRLSKSDLDVDLSLLTGQGPAYASVFVQDEDAQDEEMEIRRMHELVEQTTQVLQQARNELIALNQRQRSESSASTEAKAKKKETAACKHIDQLLWKAEVDLENVEDMYLRHIDNQKETYSLADFNQRVTRTFSDLEESINTQLDSIKSYFLR
eukprot:symbB.v1.2.031065.t1/scaffold3568.1/size55461/2